MEGGFFMQPNPAAMKSAGRKISLMVGIILSFFQSLIGQLRSGHFALPAWLLSLAVSIVVSFLISYVVPIRKIFQNVCTSWKCKPGTLKARLLETLVSDLVFTPLLTLVNVFIAWRGAVSQGARIPFLPMYLSSLWVSLLVGYVLAFFCQPLCMKLVLKNRPAGN